MDSPLLRAQNAVMIDALIEKVSQKIGFEAVAADMSYSVKVFENQGLKFKFKGYNDKLPYFIEQVFEILMQIKDIGFLQNEGYLLENAVEKSLKNYLNMNKEVDQRTNLNRLMLLTDKQYHASVIAA